jgi:Protein of unknown function (DUF3175)
MLTRVAGIGSRFLARARALSMLTFYINRAGKTLPRARKG